LGIIIPTTTKGKTMKREINTINYIGFWSAYDFLTFGEWSDSVKAQWAKYGEPWEIKPSEWQEHLEAEWDRITSNMA
jgi:hypothetical protein